jgi:hypothetical protein
MRLGRINHRTRLPRRREHRRARALVASSRSTKCSAPSVVKVSVPMSVQGRPLGVTPQWATLYSSTSVEFCQVVSRSSRFLKDGGTLIIRGANNFNVEVSETTRALLQQLRPFGKLRLEIVPRYQHQRIPSSAQALAGGTFAWFFKSRRLCRDYESRLDHSEAMVRICMIRLMVKRLAAGS